jgi:hypothetical protein
MNLREIILSEHSKSQTNKIIKWIGSDLLNHTSKPLPQFPEIRQELKTIIEDRWDFETAAFRSRAKKIFKELSS